MRLVAATSLVAISHLFAAPLAAGDAVDCYCTDTGGARIELGETICLSVNGRMFMAQCQMSLNVPMWREVQEGCLSAEAQPETFSPIPAPRG